MFQRCIHIPYLSLSVSHVLPFTCWKCSILQQHKHHSTFPKRNKVVGDLHHVPHHDLHSFLTRDSQSAAGQLSKKHPSHPNEISCGELMVSRPVPAAPWHSPWACSFCINLSAKKLSLNHLLCQKVKEKGREGMIKGLETLYEQRIATIHRLLSLSFLEVLTCCGTTKGIWFPQER